MTTNPKYLNPDHEIQTLKQVQEEHTKKVEDFQESFCNLLAALRDLFQAIGTKKEKTP